VTTEWGELRRVIEARFKAAWSNRTPVRWDGVPFVEPAGQPWVALYLLDGESNQLTLETTPRYRDVGVVVMQVFVPEDSGTQEARRLAAFAAAALRAWSAAVGDTGWLWMRAPSIERVGVDAGWLQFNVTVRYRFDRKPWAA
jgi:hypothetical protein